MQQENIELLQKLWDIATYNSNLLSEKGLDLVNKLAEEADEYNIIW